MRPPDLDRPALPERPDNVWDKTVFGPVAAANDIAGARARDVANPSRRRSEEGATISTCDEFGTAFRTAVRVVAAHAGVAHIRIAIEIPARIEKRIRPIAAQITFFQIMPDRSEPAFGRILIFGPVPVRVEEAATLESAFGAMGWSE